MSQRTRQRRADARRGREAVANYHLGLAWRKRGRRAAKRPVAGLQPTGNRAPWAEAPAPTTDPAFEGAVAKVFGHEKKTPPTTETTRPRWKQ